MSSNSDILEKQNTPGLFDRLPDTLFRPLAAQNRRLYWELLLRLYEEFFGPDAPPPEDEGWLSRTIIADIERFVSMREWEAEGVDMPSEPNARAHQVLNALRDAGWLLEERVGVRTFLAMHPTVQKFLELLKQFAEEGPQFIGGKVQLIYHQLNAARTDPAGQAAGFQEAAKQARALVSALTSTTMRVREAMQLLSRHKSTADYIQAFFSEYISELYIRDYHELRTENHPLRHRYEILETVFELREDEAARNALIGWYQKSHRTQTSEEAESLFEKDVNRFLLLQRIEDHLDRLDESVNRTTRRALAYIHYRIRTQDRLDQLLEQSFEALVAADAANEPLCWPLSPGLLLAEERLREAQVPPTPRKRTPIRRPRMSPEQRAINELRKLAQRNREVSPAELSEYVEAHVPQGAVYDGDRFPVRSVKEFCLFAALKRVALAAAVTPVSRHRHVPVLSTLLERGISISLVPGQTIENEYVITPKFRVQR